MEFFEVLADVKKSSLRDQLLLEKSSDDGFLRGLKEIAMNIVNKNISLNKVQKNYNDMEHPSKNWQMWTLGVDEKIRNL